MLKLVFTSRAPAGSVTAATATADRSTSPKPAPARHLRVSAVRFRPDRANVNRFSPAASHPCNDLPATVPRHLRRIPSSMTSPQKLAQLCKELSLAVSTLHLASSCAADGHADDRTARMITVHHYNDSGLIGRAVTLLTLRTGLTACANAANLPCCLCATLRQLLTTVVAQAYFGIGAAAMARYCPTQV